MWVAGLCTSLRLDRHVRRGWGAAASMGPLSVPLSWLWAAASPLQMLVPAGVPLASPSVGIGAGSGWPLFFDGRLGTAAVGAAASKGNAVAVKYGGS